MSTPISMSADALAVGSRGQRAPCHPRAVQRGGGGGEALGDVAEASGCLYATLWATLCYPSCSPRNPQAGRRDTIALGLRLASPVASRRTDCQPAGTSAGTGLGGGCGCGCASWPSVRLTFASSTHTGPPVCPATRCPGQAGPGGGTQTRRTCRRVATCVNVPAFWTCSNSLIAE